MCFQKLIGLFVKIFTRNFYRSSSKDILRSFSLHFSDYSFKNSFGLFFRGSFETPLRWLMMTTATLSLRIPSAIDLTSISSKFGFFGNFTSKSFGNWFHDSFFNSLENFVRKVSSKTALSASQNPFWCYYGSVFMGFPKRFTRSFFLEFLSIVPSGIPSKIFPRVSAWTPRISWMFHSQIFRDIFQKFFEISFKRSSRNYLYSSYESFSEIYWDISPRFLPAIYSGVHPGMT